MSTSAVLTFSDEFDTFQTWNGTSGWLTTQWYAPPGGMHPWNSEEQWYVDPNHDYDGDGTTADTPNPFSVQNGVLTITAQRADPSFQPLIEGYRYTSGMITTYNSFEQQYGYFEMRAQLPAGQGLWPAFWMLPGDGSWPPELDIMEVLGHDPTTLYTTVHSNSTGSLVSTSAGTKVPNTTTSFHTYGVDWQADRTTWYFDGEAIYQTATPPDLHMPMYLQANLAVGGTWPGSPDASTKFPAEMKIDFIRAWTARPDDVQALALAPESTAPQRTISGGKKSDKLAGTSGADLINGGAGGDTMTGGGGDDTYVVDDTRDTVVEAFGGGVDTVRSLLLRYTLTAEVENLVLAGTGAQTGIGNDGDNRLVANDAASTLSGGWGNDTFIAGRGAATLTGGYGQDTFVFNLVPTSAGRITDSKPGRDMLDMRGLFDAIGYEAPDPVATGHLAFKANLAGGTEVWFDRDGADGAAAASRIVTLDAVRPEQLAAQADWFFA